jgi:exodeoxyribonuclease VII large subunit
VVWKGAWARLKFKPEEGMEVIATGRLTTFPGSSKYQIVIETLEPAGVGALMALLEERKKQARAPRACSTRRASAAALPAARDRRRHLADRRGDPRHPAPLADRFPRHVLVWPVRCRARPAAPRSPRHRGFNALPPGGRSRGPTCSSWRAAAASRTCGASTRRSWSAPPPRAAIPVISAVGHETDWTLIDHAADRRAPTPTGRGRDGGAGLGERAWRAVERRIERHRERLKALDQLLRTLAYKSVLARGFAVVRDAAGMPIPAAGAVAPGAALEIEFHDGRVGATASPAEPPSKRRRPPTAKNPQGSLF